MPRGTKDGSIIKRKVARLVKGKPRQVDVWEVRKRYTKANGLYGQKRRVASSATQATATMRAIEKEIADELAGQACDETTRTFSDLATHYETNYLKPPVWHDGRKVEGMRSYQKARSALRALKAAFDENPLSDIGWPDLAKFKSDRLRAPVVIKHRKPRGSSPTVREGSSVIEYEYVTRQRSMASVQQPLKLARRMFNVAMRLGWITENPFNRGDALIVISHERKRMRILSRVEEAKLLSFCTGKRGYLADAIVCALDTALRQNEQLTLSITDVYLERRLIRVRARNAKIEEERVVPVPARLAEVLERLIEQSSGGRLFPPGTATRIKRNFALVCRLAGIENFRWHDLRHTATMRMLDAIKEPAKVMKITGHKQWATFMVYVNIDEEIALEVASAMDAHARLAPESPIEVHEERLN